MGVLMFTYSPYLTVSILKAAGDALKSCVCVCAKSSRERLNARVVANFIIGGAVE